MQVSQKLNFGDRHKAVMRHADGEAQYGLLIQQGIEYAGSAEFLLKPLRDAIDTALARHILSKYRDIWVLQHGIRQREIDAFGQGHWLGKIARIFGEHGIALGRIGWRGRWLCSFLRFNRSHHVGNCHQSRLGQCITRHAVNARAHVFVTHNNLRA